MSTTEEIEAAFRAWQEAKEYLLIARGHLAEALERGWTDHAREYHNRTNYYYEREMRLYQEFIQLRGNSAVSI